MAIKPAKQEPAGLGKLMGLAEIVGGTASGNPLLIATGAGSLASGSPAGKVASMYATGAGLGNTLGNGSLGTTGGPDSKANLGVDTNVMPTESGNDAIQRAISAGGVSASAQLSSGLQALKDNSHLFEPEDYMHYVEPLLRAKHFGQGGGVA